jgi:hypothetical protein
VASTPAPTRRATPRNEIQRPRITNAQAVDLIVGMAELGVAEVIIDVPPGRHVYLDQLRTVAEEIIPEALPGVRAGVG